jgi:penicillin-binding protein 2
MVAAVVMTGLLAGFLFWLQIVRHGEFVELSEDNYVVQASIRAPRGEILDRNGAVIAGSRQAFSICAVPRSFLRNPDEIRRLSGVLGMERAEILECLKPTAMSYRPTAVVRDADFATLSLVEEDFANLPDLMVVAEPVRAYPRGEILGHMIGYVGEVTAEEIKADSAYYQSGDFIGKAGIEKVYESRLRGKDGLRYVKFTPGGAAGPLEVEDLPKEAPRQGMDVVLHADLELQTRARRLLDGRRGSILAMDLRTGGILVMATSPGLDPGILADGVTPDEWREIVGSPEKPLLNRAIQATYPPGSTFKLVTAAAALERGIISPETTFKPCTGSYRFGNRAFRCWKPEGHGVTDLAEAIEVSCDVYFYQVGERLDPDRLASSARLWHLPGKTGIDLPGEVGGLVPDSSYYNRVLGERNWTRGVMLNLAIGQGEILLTPLEMLCFVAGIAGEGSYFRPACVDRVESPDRVEDVPSPVVELEMAPETIEVLREGMRRVVQGTKGTGRAARVEGIEIAGKTGTSQNPHGEDHAWFVCFAPFRNPEIALCVMLENAGHGGAVAAPLAGEILAAYFGVPDEETDEGPVPAAAEETAGDAEVNQGR